MVDYDSAAHAVQDENADPAFLARIAYENPEFGPNVAAHPHAYPGLLAWLSQFGTRETQRIVQQREQDLPASARGASHSLLQSDVQPFAQPSAHAPAQTPLQPAAQPDAQSVVAAHSSSVIPQSQISQPQISQPRSLQQPQASQPAHGFTPAQALDPNTDPMTQHNIAEYAPELRVYLAQNPNIYPELLTWLGSLGNAGIDAAIAARP
ncbi:MAG: hypothetical protein LKJ47_00840 [Bifidobacteriaceae bacterium]|jgi:hypothetical protein|nr:hypothetical protein [Bifidobacteriaceae bacterium]